MNPYNSRIAHFLGHHTYYEDKLHGVLQCKYCHKIWDTDKKIKNKVKDSEIFIMQDSPTTKDFITDAKLKERSESTSKNI